MILKTEKNVSLNFLHVEFFNLIRLYGLHLLEQNFRDGFRCIVGRAFMAFEEHDFLWRLASVCIQMKKYAITYFYYFTNEKKYAITYFNYFIRRVTIDVLIHRQINAS